MSKLQFPYQKNFALFLKTQSLSPTTIASYESTITAFYTFLLANRPQSLADGIRSVNETDVRSFFDYLQQSRQITLGSYNKTLTQLNRYFTYLFSHHLSDQLPTLPLHGKQVSEKTDINFVWLKKMDAVLADSHLHFYTRMTLLLLAHGYTVNEFLQPGFYKVYQKMKSQNQEELNFRQSYQDFIRPIQEKQASSDIFLKKRLDLNHPQLTNPALHKYLKSDQEYIGFTISPAKLHQAYVCYQLKRLEGKSDHEIEQVLNLDPQSLLYFKKLLIQNNL
ncbi:phage integrase N-terminal SAM-like domain-containing protein [Limosilactobacillus sp.]|uniref:phage integrase N-terminal SAM-like domain-containing protein n=1 Tax=Limosilactobacillus sp. TaxID=2773925 RepID=UPI00345ED1FB